MITRNIFRFICVFVVCASSSFLHAKEITQQNKGLTLNANLELAAGKKLSDGVVLITHGALAHRGMELISYLQTLLKEQGYSSLAINLSLGLNNRHGMYDCNITHTHRNGDAVEEIDAWVKWLQSQGVKNITMMGHSRGGAQTALYVAEHDNAAIKAAILMAPATGDNTSAAAFKMRYKKALAPVYKNAQRLIKDGKGNAVIKNIGLMTCGDTSATADSFSSYYGQDPRLDTPYLIPKIKKPIMVVVGGNDEVVVALDKKLAPLVDGKRVQMKVIEGASHFFRDLNAEDAVDAVDAFLHGAGG